MATPSEKHEIHCAKRYLEYTETPFYRAFRDRENPESFDSNYAVLKRMEEAEQSLAAVESYYEGLDVTPKFYSKPDSVTLEESRAFFEAHGYAVHTFECQRMMLLTHTSPELLVHKCPVQIFAGAPLTGAAAQLVTESCGEKDFGLRLIDKQLGAGARVSFAYNRAEIPVSFCVGEGYGSAFYLSDVYTAENFRGQGYAAAAVLAMLGFARNPDMGYADVFLYADDPAAIRLYEKLAGMTGTADTEAFEFSSIYKLDTVVVPTNRPMIRKDMPDLVYMTEAEKIQAIIEDIRERTAKGQPVLVGTISIEKSEVVSNELTKAGIKHNVLNAKFHAKEADIVAQAGYPAAVTIATNMAGRGTDIMLGGSWQAEVAELENPTPEQIAQIKADWQVRHDAVLASGGLHIIGTERHESRRIDNQLRGRAGRQGDAGSSRFYLSMEDALMRIFASDRVSGMMRKLGMKPGEAIEHPWVTKAIANAQRKVESRNFDIRKQLLEYDDVANDQRRAIYTQRNELLDVSDVSETINSIREDVFKATIDAHIPPQSLEEMWDIEGLQERLKNDFDLELPIKEWLDKEPELHEETLRERIYETALDVYKRKEEVVGAEMMRHFEKGVMLQTLDSLWKEHLAAMDYLRQGIHLRGYAQKDPKQEYKRESFSMFAAMLESLKYEVISTLSKVQVRMPEEVEAMEQQRREEAERLAQMQQLSHQTDESEAAAAIAAQTGDRKVGRNDPCPCGSGKKYKACHGRLS